MKFRRQKIETLGIFCRFSNDKACLFMDTTFFIFFILAPNVYLLLYAEIVSWLYIIVWRVAYVMFEL